MSVPKEVEIHIRVNAIVTTSNIAGIGIIAAALHIGINEYRTNTVHCIDLILYRHLMEITVQHFLLCLPCDSHIPRPHKRKENFSRVVSECG